MAPGYPLHRAHLGDNRHLNARASTRRWTEPVTPKAHLQVKASGLPYRPTVLHHVAEDRQGCSDLRKER